MKQDMKFLKPNEILDSCIETSIAKSGGSFMKLLILGIMAGVFLAFAASGSNTAAFNLLSSPETYGIGRFLAGILFAIGLMLIVLCGGELFTGNTLIITAVLEKRVTLGRMLRNWVIVYIGNLIGAIFIAWLINMSGLLSGGADLLGALTVKIAAGKTALPFGRAFILGIMCNWLVCLAVWIAFAADTMTGKIFGIFFPILLFVTSGFEHSIANMYYIPAGLFAKSNISFAELSGVSSEILNTLTWSGFFINNLLPVTLGNIVGGAVFVGMGYWYVYRRA